jgi:DNA-binding CsgD family transcriptional regulator
MINENRVADEQSNKIVRLWNEIHDQTNDKILASKYLQDSEVYHQIAKQNQQVLIISNFKKHQFLSLSNNFDDVLEYGCRKEDCMKWGMFYFSRSLPLAQIKVMIQISLWYNKVKKGGVEKPIYRQSYCGWQFESRKTGKTKYLMTNLQGLEYSEKGEPVIVMTTISDVTHLLREQTPFWSSISLEKSKSFLYHSEKSEIVQTELLSGREIEFLRAFESGLELKAISEKMEISYKTADSHRANILHRLGARNPMAAIELLKRAGLL